jgi:ABC-type Fe3+-hydroxamate transport system substrate-binding protein
MVLALDPEVLIVPMPFPEKPDPDWQPGSSLLNDPLFQSVNAVRKGRVYVLPSQHLNSISHHVVKGAVAVAHALHPERVPRGLELIPFPVD